MSVVDQKDVAQLNTQHVTNSVSLFILRTTIGRNNKISWLRKSLQDDISTLTRQG